MAEKEMWKKEVNDRRNKYHDLRQYVFQIFNLFTHLVFS